MEFLFMPYLLHTINSFWDKASRFGIHQGTNVLMTRKISTINKVCIFLSLILLIFIIRNLVLQRWEVAAVEFLALIAFGGVILLHGNGKSKLASFLFLGICNTLFFVISSFMAKGMMIEFLFVITAVLPLLIYDRNRYIYFWFIVSLAFFYFPQWAWDVYENYQALTHLTLFVTAFFIVRTYNNARKSHEKLISIQNDELKNLNRQKDELLGIAAHDLKSPLQRIQGMVQILKLEGENLRQDQRMLLDKIQQISQEQVSMVNKILFLYSAFEKDAQNVCLHIDSLCVQVIDEMAELAEKKNIELQVEVAQDLYVMGDEIFFKQILLNLISNAIKFSPAGSQVKIHGFMETDHVVLQVCDQGPGLSKADLDKVFHKYQTLSAKPTGGESTTGLGLSIVKKYAEEMKAKLDISNLPNGGACFQITFVACNPQKSQKPAEQKEKVFT